MLRLEEEEEEEEEEEGGGSASSSSSSFERPPGGSFNQRGCVDVVQSKRVCGSFDIGKGSSGSDRRRIDPRSLDQTGSDSSVLEWFRVQTEPTKASSS
jgi:hypothetical protein